MKIYQIFLFKLLKIVKASKNKFDLSNFQKIYKLRKKKEESILDIIEKRYIPYYY